MRVDGGVGSGLVREFGRVRAAKAEQDKDAGRSRALGPVAGASVLVWVGKADEDVLRQASRAGIPIVGVTEGESLPYVLDTNIVVVRPGAGMPVPEIARAIAAVVRDGWSGLAARLPVLR